MYETAAVCGGGVAICHIMMYWYWIYCGSARALCYSLFFLMVLLVLRPYSYSL